ncbi:hypothetical protein GCM10007890_66220 [Methylobacterium tardum]|uniref:Uncharacterized protein n=2 Tax=Methylobacterium tardum TaxID=374432 RepID=A0AA37WVH9_9HYPH|nr:hypothetical protein GCM10007890_66220 [Methylobacterium tardum]
MPPMPTRPIFVRVALAVVLMAALVVLADGVARHELRQAIGSTTVASAAIAEQPADASDE